MIRHQTSRGAAGRLSPSMAASAGRGRAGSALALVVACSSGSLEQAGASYRRDRDCASLRRIAAELSGAPRARVEAWLGPAEYEPTPGQQYYSSERADCSLVVDFRRAGALAHTVQQVELGAIGE